MKSFEEWCKANKKWYDLKDINPEDLVRPSQKAWDENMTSTADCALTWGYFSEK